MQLKIWIFIFILIFIIKYNLIPKKISYKLSFKAIEFSNSDSNEFISRKIYDFFKVE